jgi:Spy/CpxP family protein refolding chaperone
MSMTRAVSTLLAPLLFFFLLAAPAGAEGGKHADDNSAGGPPARRGPPTLAQIVDRQAERLGLDDATKAKVDEVANAAQPEMDQLRDRLQSQNQAMGELLSQDAPPVDKVMKQVDEIGATETKLQKVRLRTMLKIRALLTPEQRAELMKLQSQRRGKHGPKPGPPSQ